LHAIEWWPAPAKLNLFLHLLGRRKDGYHKLQTVFQFVDLCDQIAFTITDEAQIVRANNLADIPEDQDLTLRAARLLKKTSGYPGGVKIKLQKNIPTGAGLGGGSSDAATTLVALNYLWNLHLDQTALLELGLQLGADVPVFIQGMAAWAEGVGEYLEPLDLPEPCYLIVYPRIRISTAKIFSSPELTRDSMPIKIADFLAGRCRNDCQETVVNKYPEVQRALDWLSAYQPAIMTGTGACIFARFASKAEAIEAKTCAPAEWDTYVAKGCNRSLLYPCLEGVQKMAVGNQ